MIDDRSRGQALLPAPFGSVRSTNVLGAEGFYVYSDRGPLLDLNSGCWTTNFGHRYPPVAEAVARGYFADLFNSVHPAAERLASRLCETLGYSGVVFVTSGSSAVDTAVRLAWQTVRSQARHTQTGVVSVIGGYHGSTAIGLAVSGVGYARALPISVSSGVLGSWTHDPGLDRQTAEARLASEQIDWAHTAAFLFEPIQGVGGGRALSVNAYSAVAAKCREHGVVIIADEVTTGVGRLGLLAATETLEPRPDIICLGKPLANGEFAIAAVLFNDNVSDALTRGTGSRRTRSMFGETYGGHPSGCLAAEVVVGQVLADSFPAEVAEREHVVGQLLRPLGDLGWVREVRGAGLIWGVELPTAAYADRVGGELLDRGVRVVPEGSSVMVIPALNMPLDLLSDGVQRVVSAVEALGQTAEPKSARERSAAPLSVEQRPYDGPPARLHCDFDAPPEDVRLLYGPDQVGLTRSAIGA